MASAWLGKAATCSGAAGAAAASSGPTGAGVSASVSGAVSSGWSRTSDQLAALPSQAEATDAALAPPGPTEAAPESGTPSLETVERLLRERQDEFQTALQAYVVRNQVEMTGGQGSRPDRIDYLWPIEVLGVEEDSYRIRAVFSAGATLHQVHKGVADIVFIVKIDGADFEIVGHEAAVPRGG